MFGVCGLLLMVDICCVLCIMCRLLLVVSCVLFGVSRLLYVSGCCVFVDGC